ncbi:hypothetical protein GGX14DRAFT_395678 [Mycena pura]|uniref:Secreted protein n=1 Tax=Mycena pura TaxID=153505 RepID=A0AAD6Y9D7_9AGAR|nr:hypothetical protein GGX14DRAFT_395678 [Mycena pura]
MAASACLGLGLWWCHLRLLTSWIYCGRNAFVHFFVPEGQSAHAQFDYMPNIHIRCQAFHKWGCSSDTTRRAHWHGRKPAILPVELTPVYAALEGRRVLAA